MNCFLSIVVLSASLDAMHGANAFVRSFSLASARRERLIRLATAVDEYEGKEEGAKFDIGVCNIPGVDWQRPHKVNQDAYFVDRRAVKGCDYSIVGVLDGHGKSGHDVSSFVARHLPYGICNQLVSLELPDEVDDYERRLQRLAGFDCAEYTSSCSRTHQALVNAFHMVHYNAMSDERVKSGRSGSTCIACLIDNDTLTCDVAYVGDSRAICFNCNDTPVEISAIATELTVDVPSERERIEPCEGSIRGKNVFYGPVGIAMTRALGDAVMIRAGVVPTPLVANIQLSLGECLVLATDGVWDVLTNKAVRDIVLASVNAQEAADDIAKSARERWVGDLPIKDEEKADDITAVVLKV